LDIVATAIGADKVGKETHLVTPFGWYGSNIRNELQGCNKKELFLQYHYYCISLGMEHTITTLEAHRKFIGMTQAQLCHVLNIQPSTYYRWRKNGTTPLKVREVHNALLKFAKHKSLPLP